MEKRDVFIFDMDGTMFDTEPISYICWQEICRRHGYELEYDVFERFLGMNVASIKQICMETFGPDFPYDQIETEKMAYQVEYYHTHDIPIKKGLIECLDYAKEQGIPCAVASSSRLDLVTYLVEKNKVAPYFSLLQSGAHIAHGKPAPDIFLMVCDKMGVQPAKALVFEDSMNGVLAAHNAQIPVIWIPDLVRIPANVAAYAWHECQSLADVPRLLSK